MIVERSQFTILNLNGDITDMSKTVITQTAEEIRKNILDACTILKRKHEGEFSIRGFRFTRADLDELIVWVEGYCPEGYKLSQGAATLLAVIVD